MGKNIVNENAVRPKTRKKTIEAINESIKYHNVSTGVKEMIEYIIDQEHTFDVVKNYDGCTAVSDNEPKINLACFIHDFLFFSGYNTIKANKIFYKVMLEIQTGLITANTRWVGVTLVSGFFYLKGLFKRRFKKAPNLPKVFQKYLNIN